MIKNNRKTFKINMLFLLIFFLLNGCATITFKSGGRFYDYDYRYYNTLKYTDVKIDNIKITFGEFYCGTEVEFAAMILPIPLFPTRILKNNCENKGLIITAYKILDKNNNNIDYSTIFFQLKYNNKIYNHSTESTNLFKIPNYEEFKKAKDKTLIIHKKRDDGTTITKEIPFEWKLIIN